MEPEVFGSQAFVLWLHFLEAENIYILSCNTSEDW